MIYKATKKSLKDNDNLLQMPIDQFGRYNIVAQKVKELANIKGQRNIRILDIGGYKGEFHRFFADGEATITILDLYDNNDKNYVKGSALDIPFKDASFDYVVSFEVFEHIPRKNRLRYIEEAMRVSKGTFILTAPFAGNSNIVSRSEEYVNNFWRSMHNEDHIWLQEHIEYKIPTEKELEDILVAKKLIYKKIGNNDLVLWNTMLSFNYLTTLFRGDGLNPDIQSFYNQNYKVIEANSNEYYRYVYVIGAGAEIMDIENKDSISNTEKVDRINQLTSKMFISIAADIKTILNNKQLELNKISKELESRIAMYDAVIEELEIANKTISTYAQVLPLSIINKVKRLISR